MSLVAQIALAIALKMSEVMEMKVATEYVPEPETDIYYADDYYEPENEYYYADDYYEPAYYDYKPDIYYADDYYEPVYYDYQPTTDYSQPDSSGEYLSSGYLQSAGVVYDNGIRYTWYSENVLPGYGLTELNENGRHSENGYVMDGDGYIAVASGEYAKGTVLDTPFGEAKVYDYCETAGTVDVYTSF